MPQELLRDVVDHRDQTCAARRRWYVLPLSIAVHGVLAAAVLIVPLTAEVDLPTPPPVSRLIHTMTVMPVPRVPTGPASGVRAQPTVKTPSIGVPQEAPTGITPEPAREVVQGALPGPTVESGFGTVLGILGPAVTPAQPQPAPPPPVRHAPVPIGGSIRTPVRIGGSAPVYPTVAEQARLEGSVVLEAIIDERGNVERLHVVASSPLFDQAAVDAVSHWRYTPTLLNGIPVPVLMTVTVNFRLNR